jgi:hypothetical protein
MAAGEKTATRPITTLVPWYGGNRRLAGEVGRELAGVLLDRRERLYEESLP